MAIAAILLRPLSESSLLALVYPGLIHDCFLIAGYVAASQQLIDQATNPLKQAFGS